MKVTISSTTFQNYQLFKTLLAQEESFRRLFLMDSPLEFCANTVFLGIFAFMFGSYSVLVSRIRRFVRIILDRNPFCSQQSRRLSLENQMNFHEGEDTPAPGLEASKSPPLEATPEVLTYFCPVPGSCSSSFDLGGCFRGVAPPCFSPLSACPDEGSPTGAPAPPAGVAPAPG